jgi:pantetheine-phosphate adenylyltransferase
MIDSGLKLFDELVIGVGTNPDKKTMFTAIERVAMIKECFPNVEVVSFGNEFTVEYCVGRHDIQFILRGIRSEKDYEAERMMRHVNSDLNDQITTVFLIPPRNLSEVSSSMVKGLIGFKGWVRVVERYVPAPVYRKILEKEKARLC